MQKAPLLQPPDLCSVTPASQPEVPSPPQPTLPPNISSAPTAKPQKLLPCSLKSGRHLGSWLPPWLPTLPTETPGQAPPLPELQYPHVQKRLLSSTLGAGLTAPSSLQARAWPAFQSPASIPDLFLTLGIHKMVVSHVFWGLSPEPLPASWRRRRRTQSGRRRAAWIRGQEVLNPREHGGGW